MTTIKYHGKKYMLFEVEVGEDEIHFGYAANERLERELISYDGIYTDDEAQRIDESIYFYVDDNITTDEEAQKYVDDNC